MTPDFDPYHRWLGIPPKHQPADYYRLLAIERFEDDPEVIADAAERQIAHVRRYALGPHQDISQRILNELAAAKVCLLQPDEKAEYDRKLRERVAAQEPPVPQVAPPSVSPLPPVVAPVGTRSEIPSVGAGTPVPVPAVTDHLCAPIPVCPARLTWKPRIPMSPVAVVGWAGGGGILLGLLAVLLWSLFSGGGTPRKDPPTPTDKPAPAISPFDAAQAREYQQKWAGYLGVKVEFTNSIGMRFKLIPAGEFVMGSSMSAQEIDRRLPGGTVDHYADEHPHHTVRLTRPFYLGMHEVTVGDFRRFVTATGHKTTAEREGKARGYKDRKREEIDGLDWQKPGFYQQDTHPVTCVSWDDAMAFCQWLSREDGRTYRLPTEAEWEYACRAGTDTIFFWGDEPDNGEGYLNGADETGKPDGCNWTHKFNFKDGYWATSPAGRFKPNAFGLYDVLGNVWEWCSDWSGSGYYGESPVDDPPGPVAGSRRMNRGGGWNDDARRCRPAFRGGREPAYRSNNQGFRVASSSVDASSK